MTKDVLSLDDLEIESINFYHRPTTARNIALISKLKEHLIWFAKRQHGLNHYSRFRSLIRDAEEAFNARTAERLAEFTGVSSATVRKIRKGYMPSGSTEHTIITTLTDACDFYLNVLQGSAEDARAEWIRAPSSAHAMIARVSETLDRVLTLAGGVNSSEVALSPIERAELAAVLETALLMLRGPLVEKGFLTRLKKTLTDVSKRAVEKQIELALGTAAVSAAALLAEFIGKHLK